MTLIQVIVICFLILVTAFFIFVLNQIFLSFLFWFNGVSELGGIIEDLFSFASRPKKIFPRIIQNIFFLFRVLLATNISNQFLKKGINSYFF